MHAFAFQALKVKNGFDIPFRLTPAVSAQPAKMRLVHRRSTELLAKELACCIMATD